MDEKYKELVKYKPTAKLLKIWWANQKAAKKKAIAQKIAQKTLEEISIQVIIFKVY